MGNCQAIDSAALVIQHPSGKVDKLYSPIGATQIMKMNPGHYVALLLTTTLYSSSAAANNRNTTATTNNNNTPLRITRIKLLRPTDTLLLGHVYRLVTSQEVMKGLFAKKQAKMNSKPDYEKKMMMREKVINSDFEAVTEMDKSKKVKQEKQRSRNNNISNNNNKVVKWGVSKSRGWQPSLKSISEAAGS